jgi:phage tail sheath gpL-like
VGNEVDIRFNYNPGEELPAGVTTTIVQPSGGTANPDVTTAIAALGDEWFTDIAMPWSDSTNLTALETELADRWGPLRPIDGHAYLGKRDTLGNLSTFGNGRNSQFVTTLGINGSPTPAYEIGAILATVSAEELQQHPARPLTSVILPNVLAPVSTLRFGRAERDILLHDGISTSKVAPGGGVAVDRLITMYQLSPLGTLDESYLDLNTMAQLSYLRYSFRVRMAQRYERSILADDQNNVDAGQLVATPNSARLEVVALFEEWERAGLVTGVDQFKQDLRVELSDDPVRLNVLLPPNLTNPLLILAAKFEFRR